MSLIHVSGNPTVYVHVVASYVKDLKKHEPETMLKLIGGTNASLVCTCDNSWEGPKARRFEGSETLSITSSVRFSTQGDT